MVKKGETTLNFINYLVEHGPTTVRQLKDVGLFSRIGSRLPYLVNKGFIEKVMICNPNSGEKYSPATVSAYKATGKKYTPGCGKMQPGRVRKYGMYSSDGKIKHGDFRDREAFEKKKRAISNAIKLLEEFNYEVKKTKNTIVLIDVDL